MVGVEVDAAILTCSAARCEPITPAVPRVLRVDEQSRSEHVVVLELVQTMEWMEEPGLRVKVALVPQERVVRVTCLPWIAAVLFFGAIEVEERHLVVVGRRPIHFRVRVLEQRAIEGLRQAHNADILLAVGSPEPQLVLHDRAPNVEAPVRDLIGVVRLVASEQPRVADELGWQVRRLHLMVIDSEARRSLELIRAAARHEVDPQAARLHLQIVAPRVHGHLVERVEVEVRR